MVQLDPVPPGYVVHRVGSTWLILDQAHENELVRLRLAEPELRRSLFARGAQRGRGRTPSVSVGPKLWAVLRRYRHGGLLGRLTGSLFWGPSRALSELQVTARAEAGGAPVPHVLCLGLWPVVGPFWSALIGTREESQARDLLEALIAMPGRAERRRLLRRVGTAIRELHDAGVDHRDLQLRNILVRSDDPQRIVVVDLDRARYHPRGTMPDRRRAANLGRLARSAVKAGLWGRLVERRDLAAFVASYCAGNRRLRAGLRSQASWERCKLEAHRVSYPLRAAWPLRSA